MRWGACNALHPTAAASPALDVVVARACKRDGDDDELEGLCTGRGFEGSCSGHNQRRHVTRCTKMPVLDRDVIAHTPASPLTCPCLSTRSSLPTTRMNMSANSSSIAAAQRPDRLVSKSARQRLSALKNSDVAPPHIRSEADQTAKMQANAGNLLLCSTRCDRHSGRIRKR